ncbi:carboxypeptidase N subunit 2-like [Anopheles maculipalpis]|uniref:carboxypeptidase N subunit 2-like n=1 Tax=Anopheles maculipalpis TaxID=1496333 RepID=UPI002158CCEC|nr:carboxypeptidase N subunit 2-like [Anopheles maculipalpis]
MTKFTIAGLLVGLLTLNALVSYKSADAALCMCHVMSCVLINGNSSILKDAELYCPAIMKTIHDILVLRFNETTLAADILDAYTNLTSIELLEGSIQRIEPGAFEKLPNLIKIDIRRQNISTLEDYTFRGLGALEILDLFSNNLTSIAPFAFDGLKSLSRLTLSGNKLTQLPAKLISSSPMLKSIALSHNLLTSLPEGFFDNIDFLLRLDLTNNRLETFDFPDLKVMLLFLRNNSLTSLTIEDHVRFVQANQNRIRTITGTGRNVTDLVLNDNAISDVTALSHMTNLTKLSLSNNPLRSDSVFSSLPYLQELLLSNTSIKISENTFANLSSMVLLDLSFNNLTQLDFHMFSSMNELETLIVAYNQIQMINFIELREYLPKLRVLEICGNGWNSTYMEHTLMHMRYYKLKADVQGLSQSLLFQSFYVDLCSAKSETSTKASVEDADYSSEDVSDILEQEFAEFYPSSSPVPNQAGSEAGKPVPMSTTTIPTTMKDVAVEPMTSVSVNTAVTMPAADPSAVPADQQPVVGSSPLYVTFQVLVYTFSVFGVVCLVVLGYYVRQRRFDVRRLTPVDSSADSVRLM